MRPITAADLMNPEVLTLRDTTRVADAAAFLIDNEISGAPVEDDEGRLVGVVSLVDIVALTADDSDSRSSGFYDEAFYVRPDEDAVDDLELPDEEEMTVADIMTPEVYSVTEDATVSDIATKLLDGHLHRLLVLDDDKLVGILTTSDLLGLLIDES